MNLTCYHLIKYTGKVCGINLFSINSFIFTFVIVKFNIVNKKIFIICFNNKLLKFYFYSSYYLVLLLSKDKHIIQYDFES